MYVCMFSTADLEIRNVPFLKKVSSDSDLPWDTCGSHLGLIGFRLGKYCIFAIDLK